MTITLVQKILVFGVRAIVTILWYLDCFLGFVEARRNYLYLPACALTVLLVYISLAPRIKMFSNGLVANTYGVSAVAAPLSRDVVGAADAKDEFPILINEIHPPEISSESALVVDKVSSKTLFEKDINKRLAPASTTKLMTALVALDSYSLDDILSVPQFCTEVNSTKVGMPAGTEYRVKDLVYGLLVSSGGDVACTLASSKGSYSDFVWRMNRKATQIRMSNTFFTNPIGLDGASGLHFSTAEDLYKLSVAAMQNSTVRDAVRTKEYSFKSVDNSFISNLYNTNALLWQIPQTVGVKTGKTTAAGEVLMYEYKDMSKDLVIIVMGSVDRFADTKLLLNWVLASYEW